MFELYENVKMLDGRTGTIVDKVVLGDGRVMYLIEDDNPDVSDENWVFDVLEDDIEKKILLAV
ncbi:hypothetical protein [Anaerovibrio lipolyticus]|jgi:hypothetical protein|uniref:hypothetical protein n=1 Tax=Anaerovibrio lipolyticus TaxID=82374 RepID=UPI0026EA85EF|nr:hypothetical protein [Anaerovibrio lipolyticus]MBE6106939.1 hypothetical protein [Anaerovibrio lipolyticus]